jgi:L-threonine kinase
LAARQANDLGGCLDLKSHAPRERGYGTSTADIGASLFALGEALGNPFTPYEAARLALNVEPSDSTLFPGLTHFDHLQGTYVHTPGKIQAAPILVIDPGGRVSTLEFNHQDHQEVLSKLALHHEDAFRMLEEGIQKQDWELIGGAATLSAVLHQEILFNPLLDEILKLSRQIQAYGVCRAHSGTLLGVFINPRNIDPENALQIFQKQLSSRMMIRLHRVVNGGPRNITHEFTLKRSDYAQ